MVEAPHAIGKQGRTDSHASKRAYGAGSERLAHGVLAHPFRRHFKLGRRALGGLGAHGLGKGRARLEHVFVACALFACAHTFQPQR